MGLEACRVGGREGFFVATVTPRQKTLQGVTPRQRSCVTLGVGGRPASFASLLCVFCVQQRGLQGFRLAGNNSAAPSQMLEIWGECSSVFLLPQLKGDGKAFWQRLPGPFVLPPPASQPWWSILPLWKGQRLSRGPPGTAQSTEAGRKQHWSPLSKPV